MPQNSSISEQMAVLDLVSSGDLRFVDAHRLLFPEDKATLENMELREMYDNHLPISGVIA
jgi:hypothetical protein